MSNCNNLKPTGGIPCYTKMGVESRILIVPEFGSDGTKNNFANIAAVTKSALVAMIENEEPNDALYVLPVVDNVVNERAEREFEEWESGKKSKLHEGIRSFTAAFESLDTALLGRIEALEDQNIGYYAIDRQGNFIYNIGTDGVTVEPIMIDSGSFFADLKLAMYKEVGKILLAFNMRDSFNDKNLRVEAFENLDFDGRGDDLYGLYWSEIAEVVAPSITGFTVNVKTDYGVVVSGGVIGEFSIDNLTTDAAVTIATLTESATVPGQYAITYSSGVSVADILKVYFKKTKYWKSSLTLTATA